MIRPRFWHAGLYVATAILCCSVAAALFGLATGRMVRAQGPQVEVGPPGSGGISFATTTGGYTASVNAGTGTNVSAFNATGTSPCYGFNSVAPTATGGGGICNNGTDEYIYDPRGFNGLHFNNTGSATFGENSVNMTQAVVASQLVGFTTFTLSSNGCSAATLTGGATAGSVVSGTSGTCAFTVLMGNSQAATHGWTCQANDQTTLETSFHQVAGVSTTTALFSGTTVSGDVITFNCTGY